VRRRKGTVLAVAVVGRFGHCLLHEKKDTIRCTICQECATTHIREIHALAKHVPSDRCFRRCNAQPLTQNAYAASSRQNRHPQPMGIDLPPKFVDRLPCHNNNLVPSSSLSYPPLLQASPSPSLSTRNACWMVGLRIAVCVLP
jgi:hypothetical protein